MSEVQAISNSGRPANLLIVDDETPHMQALCDTLSDQGYATVGVTSAAKALALLRKQPFDLLLTDLQMPEVDGISLLREAIKIDPSLVCIMMTGHGTIDTAVQAMQVGALDYILKPFKLSAILPVLSRALQVRALRRENAELQRRVSERTAELEAANKELEAFSYSVSHDLRAPLRAIAGFAHALQEDAAAKLEEADLRHLRFIISSAAKMEQLIKGLLDLSKCGRAVLNKQTVPMNLLATEVLAWLENERQGRQLVMRVGELPDCIGDPALLRQVFVNLVSNAIKFTRKKPNAEVEIGCEERDGDRVYFVRDNGTGFSMRYAEKLFGAFQRLHRADEFEGTGIGLSIVQRIIHRHGGRVWAEAEAGQGATFYFTLGTVCQ